MDIPIVSIIVPCFNQAHFLKDCLESVRAQWFLDWECIIVDDGSTDTTSKVADEYCKTDKRFHYIFQSNRGLSGARNTGILNSRGIYVNFLDSDDALNPEMITVLLAEFEKNKALVLAVAGHVATKESLTDIIKTGIPFFDPSGKSFFETLCKGNLFPVHAGLVKRNAIDDIGLFDEQLKSCEDWDFWLRLGRISNYVAVVRRPLVVYRITQGSMTRNVGVFLNAGLTVIDRTLVEDHRVALAMPAYKDGVKDYYVQALQSFYMKCIGLYLAQKKVSEAKILFDQYASDPSAVFNFQQSREIWRNLLFGCAMHHQAKAAWLIYKQVIIDFFSYIEERRKAKNLVRDAVAEIKLYNASFLERVFLKGYKLVFR